MPPSPQLEWATPWRAVTPGEAQTLGAELASEVGPLHPLFGRTPIVVGRRADNDDVLVALDGEPPVAVVHLTWAGRPERQGWPSTVFFDSWAEWVSRVMLPDAARADEAP